MIRRSRRSSMGLLRTQERNKAVLTIGIFRSGSEDGGLFLKALPVPEREAEVLSFRLRTGLSERGIHLLRR